MITSGGASSSRRDNARVSTGEWKGAMVKRAGGWSSARSSYSQGGKAESKANRGTRRERSSARYVSSTRDSNKAQKHQRGEGRGQRVGGKGQGVLKAYLDREVVARSWRTRGCRHQQRSPDVSVCPRDCVSWTPSADVGRPNPSWFAIANGDVVVLCVRRKSANISIPSFRAYLPNVKFAKADSSLRSTLVSEYPLGSSSVSTCLWCVPKKRAWS